MFTRRLPPATLAHDPCIPRETSGCCPRGPARWCQSLGLQPLYDNQRIFSCRAVHRGFSPIIPSIDIGPMDQQPFHGIHGIAMFSDSLGHEAHREIRFRPSCPQSITRKTFRRFHFHPDAVREQDLDFWIHCHSRIQNVPKPLFSLPPQHFQIV